MQRSETDYNYCVENANKFCFKPKQHIVYFTQVILIYTVVICCLINLSLGLGNQTLWASLLSGSLGYILPAPGQIKSNDKQTNNINNNRSLPPIALDYIDSKNGNLQHERHEQQHQLQ